MIGPSTAEVVDLILKKQLTPLIVNLYAPEIGYTVVFPTPDGRKRTTRCFSYEDECELLDDVEKNRLPIFLIDLIDRYCCGSTSSDSPPLGFAARIYFKGCIGVEVRDYRRAEKVDTSEINYGVSYSVLRPTQATLLNDLEMLQQGLFYMKSNQALETSTGRPNVGERADDMFDRRAQFDNERLTLESDFWRLVSSSGGLQDQSAASTSIDCGNTRNLRYDVRARRRREMKLCLEQHFPIMHWVINNVTPGHRESSDSKPLVQKWHPLTTVPAGGTSQWKPLIPTMAKTPLEIAEKRRQRTQMQQDQQQSEYVDGMELMEEYGIELPSQKHKTRTRIRIYKRCLDSVYVGELFMERDTPAPEVSAEQEQEDAQAALADSTSECRFLLGSENESRAYIRQYLDMVSEGGRRPLTLTRRAPGKSPQMVPQVSRAADVNPVAAVVVPASIASPVQTSNLTQNSATVARFLQPQHVQYMLNRPSHSLSQDSSDSSGSLQATGVLQNQQPGNDFTAD